MRSIIYALNEDALRNGSFIHRRVGRNHHTLARYMNGDFTGWVRILPSDLKSWTLREAKKLLPKGGR